MPTVVLIRRKLAALLLYPVGSSSRKGGLIERAHQRGVATITEIQQGEPYSPILDHTKLRDVITMPAHGRGGRARLLLGNTTKRVIRQADIFVPTIRPDSDVTTIYPYRNVAGPDRRQRLCEGGSRTGRRRGN